MRLLLILPVCLIFISLNKNTHAQEGSQNLKTGEFTITTTPNDILGSEAKLFNPNIEENDKITWEVYVPENYDKNKPAGLMVFAGAPQNVRPPAGWLSVMKDKNLIWIAARASANASTYYQRELLAMMSVPLIKQQYQIDQNRIYITGEGRIASSTSMNYPDTFKGAILIGDYLWTDNADEQISAIQNNRFVFVTREKTIFPKGAKAGYTKYKNAGVENTKLMIIQDNQRYSRPKFAESIAYLDSTG